MIIFVLPRVGSPPFSLLATDKLIDKIVNLIVLLYVHLKTKKYPSVKWIELNIFTSAAFDEDDLDFAADRLQVVVTPLARQVVDAQFLTDDQMAFQDLAHLEI